MTWEIAMKFPERISKGLNVPHYGMSQDLSIKHRNMDICQISEEGFEIIQNLKNQFQILKLFVQAWIFLYFKNILRVYNTKTSK